MNDLVIVGGDGAPALHVHANPVYALYHYLAKEAQLRPGERAPATAGPAELMARARFPRDVQGYWSSWEVPITTADTPDGASGGVRQEMERTADLFAEAMRGAEDAYAREIWPSRAPAIREALGTLRETLAPYWTGMTREQGGLLGIVWPERIDAYLVPDCHDWRGGYSHPLTVGVSDRGGLRLCETMLHEATHIGDLHTVGLGREHLGDRLMDRLQECGLGRRDAWDAWHAVIFAASARQVRVSIDPDYHGNADGRQVYSHLKVPEMPSLWEEFVSRAADEVGFAEGVYGQILRARPKIE